MPSSLIDPSKVQPRAYQQNIAASVLSDGNSLVILPTGLGKTIVALLVMDKKLQDGKKILFIAPTKPLSEQHQKSITSLTSLPPEKVVLLTGNIAPGKRADVWNAASVICATPQTIENDLAAGRISVAGFGLCVVDEAHRSVKRYAYTAVAEACKQNGVQLLGLTASPGGKKERIDEVVNALGITNIEIRTETDPDVAPYVKQIDATVVEVDLPPAFLRLKRSLEEIIVSRLEPLHKMRLIPTTNPRLPKRLLLDAGKKLFAFPNSNRMKFIMLSHYATAMNLTHTQELLETQGLSAFLSFFAKLQAREEKSKAVRRILEDPRIKELLIHAEEARQALDHPKLVKLVEVVKARKGKKMIVFVQFRDQVKRVVQELEKNGITARQFVGKKDGVKLKDQQAALADFREGKFEVLVASSIGEEGLDIPSVDTVIFYEPVPSEIRLIQRRGRAGRSKSGEVVFLVTKGTRDEAYHYASKSREKKMRSIVGKMQAGFGGKAQKPSGEKKVERNLKAGQAKMTEFFE